MFGVDWGNSQTLGVNLTNSIFGIAILAFLIIVGYGVVHDLLSRH